MRGDQVATAINIEHRPGDERCLVGGEIGVPMGKAVAEAIVAHLDEGIQIPAVVLEWHLVERRSTAVMSVMGEAVRVGRG